MKRIILVILLVLPLHALCSFPVFAGKRTYQIIEDKKSYLCIADKVTGFKFNKSTKNWYQTNFKPTDKRVLSKSGKKWFVKIIGQKLGGECKKGFGKYGFIRCEGLLVGGKFEMNNVSLRYIFIHAYGYVVNSYVKGFPEGSITPYIEIGKCSSF